MRRVPGQSVRPMELAWDVAELKVEGQYLHNPPVNAGRGSYVGVIQHPFNIPGIKFDD